MRILIRPDDFAEFIEIEPGLFSIKNSESPKILYSYERLKELGFGEKKTIQIDTYFFEDEPIWIADIPFHDKIIVVENDPYDGLMVHYKGEAPNQPTR